VSSYALPADLAKFGIASQALAGISSEDQQAALDAASATADGYLQSRFRLPLTAWGDDLRRVVCQIAAYDLLANRGYAPQAEGNTTIADRAEAATNWLRDVSKGIVTPLVTETSPAAKDSPRVLSAPKRGW
jgi:phage gp36-like protein